MARDVDSEANSSGKEPNMKNKWASWIAITLICLMSIAIGFELSGVPIGTILSEAVIGAIVVFILGTFVFWCYCVWYVLHCLIKIRPPKNRTYSSSQNTEMS